VTLHRYQSGFAIALSFFVAFILTIIPLPTWASVARPEWVAMVLIYWCIAIPQRIGIGVAWGIGIFYDVLSDTLLGQHALFFILLAYISIFFYRQIRIYHLWQQSIIIALMLTLCRLPELLFLHTTGELHLTVLWSSVSSALLWYWLYIILRDIRRSYNIS